MNSEGEAGNNIECTNSATIASAAAEAATVTALDASVTTTGGAKRMTRAVKRALTSGEKEEAGSTAENETHTPGGKSPTRRKAKTSSSKKMKKGNNHQEVSIFQRIDNDDVVLQIFSFFIGSVTADKDACGSLPVVSASWHTSFNSKMLWASMARVDLSGGINWTNLRFKGIKAEGTEGTCFRCCERSSNTEFALKRARVNYPNGEGIPYYMLRELSALKGLQHPNISCPVAVNLHGYKLHVYFDYVDRTLHDYLNPSDGADEARRAGEGPMGLKLPQVRELLRQLLAGVSRCHRAGVLHRNLKPKHLLVTPGASAAEPLDGATLQLSDFALVRLATFPRRTYTTEVVTLWYRPPEILLGVKDYTPAVDMWSVGCIFAEMAMGKPLFTGMCEVDQLFQIFSKLGTPTEESWPGFAALPHNNSQFPDWKHNRLVVELASGSSVVDDAGTDLLQKLLRYDPDTRLSAEEALSHPFFTAADTATEEARPTDAHAVPGVSDAAGLRDGAGAHADAMEIQLAAVAPPITQTHAARFLTHLKEKEAAHHTGSCFLDVHDTDIRGEHRSQLVDWLVEVVDAFDMCERTAFLATSYTDEYLTRVKGDRKTLQLIGATCLHIASKCEDVSYIGIEDLSKCADNGYSGADVIEQEQLILNELNFDLAIPTVLDFVNAYREVVPSVFDGERVYFMCKFLAEVTLLEPGALKFKPSLLATCIVVYSQHILHQQTEWQPEFAQAAGFQWSELRAGFYFIRDSHVRIKNAQNLLRVIPSRYSKSETSSVALVSPPSAVALSF